MNALAQIGAPVTIARANAQDVFAWPIRACERATVDENGGRLLAAGLAWRGQVWKICRGGRPVLLAGYDTAVAGVAEVFMYGTDQLDRQPDFALRRVLLEMGDTIASIWAVRRSAENLRRLHCFVRADNPRHIRFALAMGFVAEGTLKNFGQDGTDMTVMRFQEKG